MNRRNFFSFAMGSLSFSAWAGGIKNLFTSKKSARQTVVKQQFPIDFQWPVQGPFLFCVHHNDRFPKGNKNLGVDPSQFVGRNMGQDFELKNGFRLYHGKEIPGFPVHPHRGFETITIVRQGYIDHADSLGAAGRYGEGDVQWMTAGAGVQHSEMFPLLHQDKENTVELFQIWLNLPKKNKMVPPDFKMLWANTIPKIELDQGNVVVSLVSGEFQNKKFYQAPVKSWAANPENEVNILLVKMKPNATFTYPKAKGETNRTLYLFEGDGATVNGVTLRGKTAAFIDGQQDLQLVAGNSNLEFLMLEARPIHEPVFQHGPFVMNTREEIVKTFEDYQKTHFGGWPWPRQDMIHGSAIEKFAKYPDGKIVRP